MISDEHNELHLNVKDIESEYLSFPLLIKL